MQETASAAPTFLFTDIEGSTRLWEEHPEPMRTALRHHDDLLRACIEGHGGRVFKTVGDAFCAAFPDPAGAVATALAVQEWLPAMTVDTPEGPIPIRVRIAVHTGRVEEREGDYFGPPVNRVARLLAIAHGGQTLVSEAARANLGETIPGGASLEDRGRHRLKDLEQPEWVFELCHPDLPGRFPALRSLSTHANNLPQQVTSFVGRQAQVSDVVRLLREGRLLTLVGPGGCGKTRLALQAAADLLERFPDGVWLVDLAPLEDAGLVPQTLAAVLGLKEEPGRDMGHTLSQHLRNHACLLMLDNCEHVLGGCVPLADALLRECPAVRILATSREGLRISGETVYPVPPLSSPVAEGKLSSAELLQYEAVQLFVARATQVRPDFALEAADGPAMASICRRLDGVPLALELAAARVRSMSVRDVNARLDQRFRLLTGGSRVAMARQQTLRALIDWSYDLLNEGERTLLQRLAIFSGGWTLDAAEVVCGGEGIDTWEVVDLLTALVDKSLVAPSADEGRTRYRLLETVREYATDRRTEQGTEGGLWNRFQEHFLLLAEDAERQLTGADQREWLERLDREHDNLRSALTRAVETGDAETGLRMAGALWRFWYVRGRFVEGRARLMQALELPESESVASARSKALNGAGTLAYQQSDFEAAGRWYRESLTIRRRLGDRLGIAALLNNLGNVVSDQGDYVGARALYEESLELRRQIGDRLGIADALGNLGLVAHALGDHAAARTLLEEGLALRRDLWDRWGIAVSLNNLGNVALSQGDLQAARALSQESLEIYGGLGDRRGTALALGNLARVALVEGDPDRSVELHRQGLAIQVEVGHRAGMASSLGGLAAARAALGESRRAARLWGAGERLRESLDAPLPPNEAEDRNRLVSAARDALADDASFAAAWDEGRGWNLDEALAHGLEVEAPQEPPRA